MMVESLLNPEHEVIRTNSFEFGLRLAHANSEGHIMLLQLLSDFSKADEHSSCCKEYYNLIVELIRLKSAPGMVHLFVIIIQGALHYTNYFIGGGGLYHQITIKDNNVPRSSGDTVSSHC